MRLTSIGQPIATREFFVLGDSSRKVQLVIGKPVRFDDDLGYYCPFQFIGVGHEHIRYAEGLDEVQSIELAFRMIVIELSVLVRDFGIELRWDGKPEDPTCGLPAFPF